MLTNASDNIYEV